jgi:hypothetical protein
MIYLTGITAAIATANAGPPPPVGDLLLAENDDFLVAENDDFLEQE